MPYDESRHDHLPTEGGKIFAENGSETVEDDQTDDLSATARD